MKYSLRLNQIIREGVRYSGIMETNLASNYPLTSISKTIQDRNSSKSRLEPKAT